jgi:hypothetical protein
LCSLLAFKLGTEAHRVDHELVERRLKLYFLIIEVIKDPPTMGVYLRKDLRRLCLLAANARVLHGDYHVELP